MPDDVVEGTVKWELRVVLLLLFAWFEVNDVFEEMIVAEQSLTAWNTGSTFSLNKVICTKWGMFI